MSATVFDTPLDARSLVEASAGTGKTYALAGLFEQRGQWEARRDAARTFVERERNWSSNISRYTPVYQRLTGKA